MKNKWETRVISSLEKVLPQEKLEAFPFTEASALKGEVFSFQIAYLQKEGRTNLFIEKDEAGDLARFISLRRVGLSPSEYSAQPDHDDDVINGGAGLFPDPLYPLSEDEGYRTYPNQWRSVWVTVRVPLKIEKGKRVLNFTLLDDEKNVIEKVLFTLYIGEQALPAQKLLNTHWFHGDCIASYYGIDVFSPEHWIRLEQFFLNCTAHGMNMLLTPVFTPPLDTKVGGERPTIQLIGVEKRGEKYTFDLSRLERWIDLAFKSGFTHIEVSHLATQWGAEFCPKIMAMVEGKEEQIFGWHTRSLSPEYLNFLDQLLPELDNFFIKKKIKDRVFFHVSDEPHIEHLNQFQKLSHELRSRLKGYEFIDALSNFEFYKSGAVPTPIPAENHIEAFLEAEIEDLWTYFCVSQYKDVPNRFFSMPSARNRIMGFLLYKFRIKGFLHWGYNFYYSQYSIRKLNPFLVTDAGGAFPSGDSFLVYPGEDGPIDSIRHEVFNEALQDLRSLELLENLKGRDFVMSLLESDLEKELSFKDYPRNPEWILNKREMINRTLD
jgi:hypothetical protein